MHPPRTLSDPHLIQRRPERSPELRSARDLDQARRIVASFEAARLQGKDRALVDGLWVEVPTYRNALKLLAAA